MKPGELTNGKYADFAKLSENLVKVSMERFDPNKAKLRASFEAGNNFIRKLKLEADKSYAVLLPLELCLPFHPETLAEDIYNKDNPLPLAGSPTTAALSLKKIARDNEEFAQKLAEVMATTVKELNLDTDYISGDREIKLWHRLARLQYITGTVQHLNTNPSKFKFGKNCGCEAILNDAGDIVGTVGIGYQLTQMENALISVKVQMVNDSYESGGENADRPIAERDSTIKNLWKDRLIGNPFKLSFARVITFETDTNGNLGPKTISDWNKEKKIKPLLKYIKITNDKINIFESVLGEKADTSMDFIEARIQTPALGESDRMDFTKVNYATASRDNSIFRMSDSDDNIPEHDLRNFKEEYSKFRDNEKLWNDDILRKSIYDFRPITDDALLAEMQESVKIYEDAMKSTDVVQTYGEILSQINGALVDEALTNIMSGEENGIAIDMDIANSAPVHDELNDPTDGDIMSNVEDILGDISGISDINDINISE